VDIAALLNVVLVAVSVGVALIAGLSYGSRKALREANADLRDRVNDLEKSDAKKTAEIAELKSRNDVLTSMVTGEVHWQALTEDLDQLIRDAHKHWHDEHESLTKVLVCLDKVIDKLDGKSP
jgi:predicted  nucleic acid-binding Zn-ribbon protein